MKKAMKPLHRSTVRVPLPYALLIGVVVVAALSINIAGKSIGTTSVYATLQYFSVIGPVALGLGLAMMVGQFDLSVGAMFGLAGIVAVQAGQSSWELGMMAALGVGIAAGLIQGTLVSRLNAPSLPITLGGLVTLSGLGYMLTGSQSVSFPNYVIGIDLNEPIASIFSIHSLIALGCFVVIGCVLGLTRVGRDLYACGDNPNGAKKIGLHVSWMVLGVLVLSALLAAMSGTLVAYSLSSASPQNASNPLIPAAIAAVLGGVAVAGGSGTAGGILAGTLTLTVLNTTFNILAAPEFLTSIAYGGLLLIAIAVAAPDRRLVWERVKTRVRPREVDGAPGTGSVHRQT